MRSLSTLWLLLIVFQVSLYGTSQKPEISHDKTQHGQSDEHKTNNSPVPCQTQPDGTPDNQGASDSSAHKGDAAPDNRIVWFTGVLAAVAILQLGAMAAQFTAMCKQSSYMQRGLPIAIRSARAANTSAHASKIAATASLRGMELAAKNYQVTKESVQAATIGAEAAKKSADALINSERAWVMVDIEWTPGYGTRLHETDFAGDHTHVAVRLTCRNEGRTPAWITEKRARIEVAKDLIAKPEWDAVDVIQAGIEGLGVQRSRGKGRDFSLRGDGWEYGVEHDGTMTVIYGIIKYQDPFSDERTTTFGWKILPNNEFQRLGLGLYPAYNEYT
jgi:hypothetical protein